MEKSVVLTNPIAKLLMMARAGATFLSEQVANLTPVPATKLLFEFTTAEGNKGSFTLNSNMANTEPAAKIGFFVNAITNYTFNNSSFPSADLSVHITEDGEVAFNFVGFQKSYNSANLKFAIDSFSVKQLSKNPSDYKKAFKSGQIVNISEGGTTSFDVVSLTVTELAAVSKANPVSLSALDAGELLPNQNKATITA